MVSNIAYHGRNTTFDVPDAFKFDGVAYDADIKFLEALPVWSGTPKGLSLWQNQKQAIALGAAYVRVSQPTSEREGALIKMPTGSGKSGVIAVLTRCLPKVRRALVLTPREGLVQQMHADIRRRFWVNMGCAEPGDEVWSGPGVEPTSIEILLPNSTRTKKICNMVVDSDRTVLVGTLQALDKIRTDRDKLKRKGAGGQLEDAKVAELARLDRILELLGTFDLVVVDEGHYEPAPSWSRSVRELALPTILLSATPFRNDYKLFTVRGSFAYNFSFPKAAEAKIVREVHFATLDSQDGSATAIDSSNKDTDQELTDGDASAIKTFATQLLELAPQLTKDHPAGAKIIVRAASWSALAALQPLLAGSRKANAVLIHDQVGKGENRKGHPLRFVTVREAQNKAEEATFWLHQTKLLEGIDDPMFVAVAILDDFTNERQLVQQIGRVLRSTDAKRQQIQTATVVARNAEQFARLKTSWEQYLAFETAGEESLASIIPGEAYLPEKIVPGMPDQQYVDGSFRQRLPVTGPLHREDLLVPRRAAIFTIGPDFDATLAETETREGILARNRFVVHPVTGLPKDVWGWTFFTVDESPYLSRHFVTEWQFGVTLMVRINDRLFVFDTDGVPFDASKIGVTRLDRQILVRLFGPSSNDRKVRITKLAAASLEMADRAIRTTTTSTASFEDTFTDLLDAVLLPTNVAGYVGGTARYLGLSRSKVTDASVRRVGVDDYVKWATNIDRELTAVTVGNRVFDRFAQLTTPDPDKAIEPRNILLDLQPLDDFGVFIADRDGQPSTPMAPSVLDLCADIDAGQFQITMIDGNKVGCSISYNPKSGRYAISSDELNAIFQQGLSASGTVMTLTERINAEQAFRVLTDEADKVYMHGKWAKAREIVSDGRVPALDVAVVVEALRDTFVEKGEDAWANGNVTKWHKESIFGLTAKYIGLTGPAPDEYAKALREFPLVLLDDDGQEMADFILVSDSKVVLLHAKALGKDDGDESASVTAIQEVGRQVAASLGFFLTSSPQIENGRWQRAYTANKTTIPAPASGSIRIFRNSEGLAPEDVADRVRAALRDRRIAKEVWLVAGRLLNIETARERALASTLNNRTRQLIMYIDGLSTTCGRANARLRIFAH
ncbi:MAG: DEAD/DEAH box helicase family protein [Salinicola sp.]|uniref:DEAD/DEAH box helicase n=1 Tax=Salinicola sp. TaxID=1978524 RepID=UPI001DE7FE0D|nr:DEAD/DEAH box helicase family protein [Salinicola sp.]NRB54908.1 DEAD/DEAH box helicase family protein [Salinicola sp.]